MSANIQQVQDQAFGLKALPPRGARSAYKWLRSLTRIARSAWVAAVSRWRKNLPPDIPATLDIDELSARLEVEHRAQADGRSEQPPATEQTVSGAQKEIILHFRELHRQAHNQSAAVANALRAAGEEIDLREGLNAIHDIPSRTENDIRRLMAEHESQLALLRDREIRQREHYASFREKHHLQRLAAYPGARYLYYAFIGAFLLLCALAVDYISSSQGIEDQVARSIGPIMLLSLVAVSVIVPFVVGSSVLRSVNHVSAGTRFIGWLGGMVCVTLVAAIALFIGHYVATFSANPAATLPAVLDSMLAAPLELRGVITAWAALGAVVLAGLLALLVGYKSDDAYPGYGAAQRALYNAHKEREVFTKRLRSRMNTIIDKAASEVDDVLGRFSKKITQYSRLIDRSTQLPASLSAYETALEDACNIVLERYRRANQQTRQTTAPATFMEQVCLKPEQDPELSGIGQEFIGRQKSRLEQLQHGIRELEEEAARVRQQLRDLNWLAISELSADEDAG